MQWCRNLLCFVVCLYYWLFVVRCSFVLLALLLTFLLSLFVFFRFGGGVVVVVVIFIIIIISRNQLTVIWSMRSVDISPDVSQAKLWLTLTPHTWLTLRQVWGVNFVWGVKVRQHWCMSASKIVWDVKVRQHFLRLMRERVKILWGVKVRQCGKKRLTPWVGEERVTGGGRNCSWWCVIHAWSPKNRANRSHHVSCRRTRSLQRALDRHNFDFIEYCIPLAF